VTASAKLQIVKKMLSQSHFLLSQPNMFWLFFIQF
jgi:hypothetical protein